VSFAEQMFHYNRKCFIGVRQINHSVVTLDFMFMPLMAMGLVKLASKCFGNHIFVILFLFVAFAIEYTFFSSRQVFIIIVPVSCVNILAENRVSPMEFFCGTGRQIERMF
jgi:hypothetical protein